MGASGRGIGCCRLNEIGSVINEENEEHTCSNVSLSKTVKASVGVVFNKETKTLLTRLHFEKWMMAWGGNTLIRSKDYSHWLRFG